MAQTSFKQRCMDIHERMKEPTEKQVDAIYRRVFKPGRIRRSWHGKPISYCSECGGQIHNPSLKECPHCHAKLTAEPQDFQRMQAFYHMVLEAKGDIQVCRFFIVKRWTQYGKATDKQVWEVERIMYAPDGERKVFARGVQGMSWYYDAWSLGSEMRLRQEYSNQSQKATLRYNLDIYTFQAKSLTQQWRYKDIPALLEAYGYDTSVLRVIAYPWGETLFKTGQRPLFDFFVKNYKQLPAGCHHALNICNRNHYVIADPSMWLDHLRLLRFFHLDTHNAHYVCPADLRAEHQRLLERKRRVDEQRHAEARAREEQRRKERDKAYAAMIANWAEARGAVIGLNLTGDNLSVRPLQSVEEFKEEGAAMHHCVYANGYYDLTKHPNTLILSAKDSEGHRLATIEYNTARHNIVQCRAVCNGVPERDAEIRALITDHRKDIEALLMQEVKVKATKKKQQNAAVHVA